jgi:hypothetical protein
MSSGEFETTSLRGYERRSHGEVVYSELEFRKHLVAEYYRTCPANSELDLWRRLQIELELDLFPPR